MDENDDLGPGLLVHVSGPAWNTKILLLSPLPDSPASGLIPSQADRGKPHIHPDSTFFPSFLLSCVTFFMW